MKGRKQAIQSCQCWKNNKQNKKAYCVSKCNFKTLNTKYPFKTDNVHQKQNLQDLGILIVICFCLCLACVVEGKYIWLIHLCP